MEGGGIEGNDIWGGAENGDRRQQRKSPHCKLFRFASFDRSGRSSRTHLVTVCSIPSTTFACGRAGAVSQRANYETAPQMIIWNKEKVPDQKDNITTEPRGVAAQEPPAEAAQEPDLAEQLASITAERDRLAAEKAELNDRLLRRQAEFENFRRRSERDRSEFLQYAGMELVDDLLPVLDDFARALKTETADRNYAKGVELIYQRFFETLKKMGLEPIDCVGQKFDPHLHQAVDRVQTAEAEDQTILEEYQKGYNFKGKLLRPAMVKVAVKP